MDVEERESSRTKQVMVSIDCSSTEEHTVEYLVWSLDRTVVCMCGQTLEGKSMNRSLPPYRVLESVNADEWLYHQAVMDCKRRMIEIPIALVYQGAERKSTTALHSCQPSFHNDIERSFATVQERSTIYHL